MEAWRSQKHFHLNPDDKLCCGDWYSTGLLRQIAKVLQHASGTVEQWKTVIDLPHMNLIIFPPQHALPLGSAYLCAFAICCTLVFRVWSHPFLHRSIQNGL